MNTKRILSIVFVLIAASSAAATAQMHSTPAMTVREFSSTASGQPIQVAVRVESLNRTALHAQMLERRSEGVYASTGKRITLYFPDGTPVIMGSAADIAPGAVLFIYGVATKHGEADVKRVVVMSRYVQVK